MCHSRDDAMSLNFPALNYDYNFLWWILARCFSSCSATWLASGLTYFALVTRDSFCCFVLLPLHTDTLKTACHRALSPNCKPVESQNCSFVWAEQGELSCRKVIWSPWGVESLPCPSGLCERLPSFLPTNCDPVLACRIFPPTSASVPHCRVLKVR